MKNLRIPLLCLVIVLSGLLPACSTFATGRLYQADWNSLDSRPTPAWFLNAKFGIFITWGIYSVPAWGQERTHSEWYWQRTFNDDGSLKDDEWGKFHRANYGENFNYSGFAPLFRCELFEPDEWADVFGRSGAKYVVLTAKHHDGFCLWQSKEANKTWGRSWNSADTGPRRDLLGDLTKAVRAKGLKMGFYYSLYEWFNPLWRVDRKRYVNEHMWPQFKDVVNRYQPAIVFSDGEGDLTDKEWRTPELLAWLFNDSPCRNDVVINDRWGKDVRYKHGGYCTSEYGAGLEAAGRPWEENTGISYSFGYNRNESLSSYKTTRELVLMLIDVVSRGGNLLIDVGPTGDGRIPMVAQSRLIEIGQWLAVNGEAIYGTRPWNQSHQWSEGVRPAQTPGQYKVGYNVVESVGKPTEGKAVIEAFFTSKPEVLYAIVPSWPGRELVLKSVTPKPQASITILGVNGNIPYRVAGTNVVIDMSGVTPDMLPCQWAHTLKIPVEREIPKPKADEVKEGKPQEEKIEDKLEKALIDRLGDILKKK